MARSSSSTVVLAAAAVVLLIAAAAPIGASAYPKRDAAPKNKPNAVTKKTTAAGAKTGLDCAAALHDAAKACAPELKLVDSKAKVASASSLCCAAAAKIYSPAFASACACQDGVVREAARLTAARAAAQLACPALKTAAAAIPACPSAAASASRNGTAAALPSAPVWGTGSVCASQDAPRPGSNNPCATKCTPRPPTGGTPTDRQVASARNCASNTKGFCDGLTAADDDDVESTGLTQCDKGAEVPDPTNRGRRCFQCCTVRLAPVGSATRGKNACKNPNSGGGGGGGGGGCFPGESTVVVEGGSSIALRDLKIGDKVLSADPSTGALSFQDVYFFVHMAEKASSEFVRLEVDGGALAVELTRKHLVPVVLRGGASGAVSYARAADVAVGDAVLVVDALTKAARRAQVTAKSSVVRSSGLYAPVTMGGGHIVVSSAESTSAAAAGVVASVHSDWILDPLFEKLGAVSSLHAAYERTHGALLRAAYRVLGAAPMQRINPLVSALANGETTATEAGATVVRALAATAATARKA